MVGGEAAGMMRRMTDVGLYVHVPFCPSKCGYCDFESHVPDPDEFSPLVDALLMEMVTAIDGRDIRVDTIFVGGGTPTFLPTDCLQRLFDRLGRYARGHRATEFTVETNPGTLDADKAEILRACGVNRISMGAQSFHESELAVLERRHRPDQISRSAAVIRETGFPHFNIDLIFGVPGQNRASWGKSIRRAIDLGPDHLACYGLTYEPGTRLYEQTLAGSVNRMGEDLEAALYTMTMEQLPAAGFQQYEISSYARPGARSLHNLRYWYNLPTVGIGPAAASYLDGQRWRNVPESAEYVRRTLAGEPTAIDIERLEPIRRAGETAMLMLRLTEGIGRRRFRESTGFDAQALFAEPIERHHSAGRLLVDRERIALTPAGRLVADSVMADFLNPSRA